MTHVLNTIMMFKWAELNLLSYCASKVELDHLTYKSTQIGETVIAC